LQKRLNVETLVLRRAVIDLERNTAGENNWSDFTSASGDDDVGSELGLSGFTMGGVELTDSNITWLDVSTGKRFKISKMKLATEAVVEGQPLPVTFKAYVRSNQPEWQASVFVKTNFEFDDDSPVFNANKLKLVVKAQLPSSDLEKISIAMITDGEINVQTQTAKLSKVRLSILGLVMSGELDVENIFSVPVIHGPLKVKTFEAQTLAERLKVTMPRMENTQRFRDISLSALFKTDFDSIYLDDIAANIDESSVNGFIHISNFQQPVVSYDLDVDNVNLHDYRAADDASGKNELPLPLDLIRSSDLEGTLDIETVTVDDDIQLKEFHITSQIKDGIVEADPITMLVGESEVDATMRLDASNTPEGVFSINVNNVDATASINPLLKTITGNEALVLEGLVNATASFQVTGESVVELKKSAKGTVKITMDEPLVQGIDINHASRSVVSDYANKNGFRTRKSYVTEYKPDRKTRFDNLSATFKVANGKWVNNDLLLVSKEANITGSGSIDFINSKLDYRPVIDVNVNSRVDIRDKLRDHPMEYHAYGRFEKVTYKFDVDKYELLVGRLLIQEAKTRSIKQKKSNTWNKYKSK
ncbi:MAG: AsmA family protein, partial [Candidatus Scalindua sp.]|nr:AsmA family protein [Candidatus Scalindua sp.]